MSLKIAVVHWVLNDVGGINSWTENFILGLERLGYEPQLYYGTHQRKLGCEPDKKVPRSRRWHLLPALQLSYDKSVLAKSIRTLNQYDVIVFAHPSPHPTKGNMQCRDPRGWQAFYRDTTAKKICVFHDRHWDRSNEWISEVKDTVDYAHAAQHHFISSVIAFSSGGKEVIDHGWGYFPLEIPKKMPDNEKRVRRFILATQWLALKNHRFLIPRLNELMIPLHSYGSGQTYHKLLPEMKKVYREDHHQDEVQIYNKQSRHIHFGHTEYRKLLLEMSRSWFSLDLSIQGMTNMTHWEPMTVGTLSVMERRVLEDEFCEIPEDCCQVFDLDTILEDLNRIGKQPTSSIIKVQQRASQFVGRCDCAVVAGKLLLQAGIKPGKSH